MDNEHIIIYGPPDKEDTKSLDNTMCFKIMFSLTMCSLFGIVIWYLYNLNLK